MSGPITSADSTSISAHFEGIVFLTSTHTLPRETMLMYLCQDCCDAHIIDISLTERGELQSTIQHRGKNISAQPIDTNVCCLTCAIRDYLCTVIPSLAQQGVCQILVVLPCGIEANPLACALETAYPLLPVASVAHAVDAQYLINDFISPLTYDFLSEQSLFTLSQEDDASRNAELDEDENSHNSARSVSDISFAQLTEANAILLCGCDNTPAAASPSSLPHPAYTLCELNCASEAHIFDELWSVTFNSLAMLSYDSLRYYMLTDPLNARIPKRASSAPAQISVHYTDEENPHYKLSSSQTSREVDSNPNAKFAWTAELSSDSFIHPDRLHLFLNAEGLPTEFQECMPIRSRGFFSLPTRPFSLYVWDGSPSCIRIAELTDDFDSLFLEPPQRRTDYGTHLVISGYSTASQREKILMEFTHLLLSEDEQGRGIQWWLGRTDALTQWISE